MRTGFPVLAAACALIAAFGCGSREGDLPSNDGTPSVLGGDKRVRDVVDPAVPGHAERVDQVQAISGAVVVAVDTYDEARTGRSQGTIYVQDLGSSAPFSGVSLFAATVNPGSIRVRPGDVVDLRGRYTETATIGATVTFPPGSVLPQISQPIATFRYETQAPTPVVVSAADLTDFATGRQWLGMLVEVHDVVLQRDAVRSTESGGRLSVDVTPRDEDQAFGCNVPFPKPVSMTNDLFDVAGWSESLPSPLVAETRIRRLVGVVGFFCNLRIAPRSPADIEVETP